MNLSSMVAEWVTAYEQEIGKNPTAAAVHIARHIGKVGDMLREQGRQNAQEGQAAYRPEIFPALVSSVFRMGGTKDPEFVQSVSALWETEYQEGYREGGGVIE